MGKKIGILTFHYALNYGAVLQAFSLLRNCEVLGYDVEIVNYFTREHEVANRIIFDKHRGVVKSLFYTILVFPNMLKLWRKQRRFNQFREEALRLSRRYKTATELLNNLPDKDAYITGSDQVFNPVSDDNISVYYLEFTKRTDQRKIAYAPSFGISTFDISFRKRIYNLINDFDYLSCREDDGAVFLSNITGRDVPTVLDPVFLWGAPQWRKVMSPYRGINKCRNGYIFVYDLNGREHLLLLAKKLQNKTNLPIVCLTTKKYLIGRLHAGQTILDAGPREFLSLIANASFVVTDSFHGVAFSIVFQKKFLAFNALPKASQRIKSLLEDLSLSERFIVDTSVDDDSIYAVVGKENNYIDRLNVLIASSRLYLEESLKSV